MSYTSKMAFALAALAAGVTAHMQVDTPTPLRDQNNPFYKGSNLIDYSMTSPLAADGSNFPCKGYNVDVPSVSQSVATLVAGSSFTVNIKGGASHEGGSCQFSLSYDNGKTFGVVHNEVGGCPLKPSYTFDIPSGVPAGKNILLSWTWFNKVGNREMYQNCVAVDVNSTSTSPFSAPRMFEANIGNGCTTIEGTEIDFADPSKGLTGCNNPITPDQKVTLTGNGGSGGGQAPPPPPPPSTPTKTPETPEPTETDDPCPPEDGGDGGEDQTPVPTVPAPPQPTETDDPCPPEDGEGDNGGDSGDNGDDGEDDGDEDDCPPESEPSSPASPPPPPPSKPTSTPTKPSTPSTPPPTSAPAPPTSGGNTGGACVGGAIQCGSTGATWSMCSNGVWINMGPVAPGTTCKDGKHVALVGRAGHRAMRRLGRDH